MVAQPPTLRPDGLAVAPIPPQNLSMKKIRDAIPPHCFERSLLTSLKHLCLDLLMIFAMGLLINRLDVYKHALPVPAWVVSYVCWPLYWWWQGAVMTGVWVLAHECGHQSFSPWKSVNDAFGLVLHSLLFVPYHSWRITHGTHHKNTNHMDNDQVFVPSTRDVYNKTRHIQVDHSGTHSYRYPIIQVLEESPIGEIFGIFQMLLLGWWAYLTVNIAGQDYGKGTNHFNPKASMFSKRDYWDVILSDVGIFAAFALLAASIRHFGFATVVKYYFIPYLFVNMWLVLITYLQHSDPSIPHYTAKEFSFVRGALCSVDRDYGIYNTLHHHIGDTHVAHHLFSQMPFYHAQEATEAIKEVLGEYYCYDNTNVWKAVFRSWEHCKFVDPSDGDIMYYHNYKKEQVASKQN